MGKYFEFKAESSKSIFCTDDLLFISKKDDSKDVIEVGLVESDFTTQLYYDSEAARDNEFNKLLSFVSDSHFHYLFKDQDSHLILLDNIMGVEKSDIKCLEVYLKGYHDIIPIFYNTDKEAIDDYNRFLTYLHSYQLCY